MSTRTVSYLNCVQFAYCQLIILLADAPRYRLGNRALLAVTVMNITLYVLTKGYYIFRNKQKAKIWNAMTQEEQVRYMESTSDKGNKRLDFRFVH